MRSVMVDQRVQGGLGVTWNPKESGDGLCLLMKLIGELIAR